MSDCNYYLTNKRFIMKAVNNQILYLKKVLDTYYSEDETRRIIDETNSEFENLLPQMPYIGGKDNLLTKQLVGTSPYLVFYKVMKKRNVPVETIGKIIYESSVKLWNSYPKFISSIVKVYFKSKGYFNKTLCNGASQSQNRRYPGDFVYSAVKGNGTDFDYGIDYTECAICKFFHQQESDELTPYMCLIDYAQSDALNLGLVRTKTIAEGQNSCDFRFKLGKSIDRNITNYFMEPSMK